MLRYLIRRVLISLVAVLGVVTLVFVATRATGDPVLMMLPENSPPDVVEHFRRLMGYDQPIYVQYGQFLMQAVTGSYPDSIVYQRPALEVLAGRAGYTVNLAVAGFLIAAAAGLPLGYLAARGTRRWSRNVSLWVVNVLQATPSFYLAIIAVLVFSVSLGWFPTGKATSWTSLVLPALALGLHAAPPIARVFRNSLVKVSGEDFVDMARAKGVGRRRIAFEHVIPNALLPVLTVLGMELGVMLGGTVLIETVFSWPGLGQLSIESINRRDYPVLMSIVTMLAMVFVAINLIIDLAYAWLDPRVRVAGRR